MRKDMFKVIVERPRLGRGWDHQRQPPADLEQSPVREGLRARHRALKSLNENLRPLERYLARQVGRPWDKVYAEICAGIDRRSTVQQHIHQHIGDFVAVRVVTIGGAPHAQGRWGDPRPLAEYWAPRFFVDPRTGLLRVNRLRERARRAWEATSRAKQQPSADRRELSATRQLQRIGGVWFEVDLAPLPAAGQGAFDVVLHARVPPPGSRRDAKAAGRAERQHGHRGVYACGRRQLPTRALREHGLANDPDE